MPQIRKNDKVKVLSGKEKGRQGRVLKVIKEKGAALVERLNFVKRHTRAGKVGQQGGIIEKEAPIRLSKLMVVCPKCSKPTRTGTRVLDDGTRVRYCKKCSEQLES
ncbi:MAG: 50S ribosomal protein L24 [Desulfomonile tiedjei]|uniref:Large ribosomal subunit protein uL24 n=1 Tax=Desulfomonile tiedjei TaxID=2358 RepID=A0A9D6V511_9BACT|nr:50S ribosomal protein L24 [Desulfomonile tiedjei]